MLTNKHLPSLGNLLEASFNLLPDPVFCFDRRSEKIIRANTAACSALGYLSEDLVQMPLERICAREDIVAIRTHLDAIPEGQPASVMIRTRHLLNGGDSESAEWHVSRHYLGDEGAEQWVVVARILLSDADDDRQPGDSKGLGLLGHDPLTQLPNRRLFERRLERTVRCAQENPGYQFAVCFLDLDRFKEINDRMGHLFGDRVLCEVARRLVACVRPGDMVARFGGDEFTVLIDNLYHSSDAEIVGYRILQHLNEPMTIEGHLLDVGASIGMTTGSHCFSSVENILHDADQAMYQVKMTGGSNLEIHT